jgi:hypothetical protein
MKNGLMSIQATPTLSMSRFNSIDKYARSQKEIEFYEHHDITTNEELDKFPSNNENILNTLELKNLIWSAIKTLKNETKKYIIAYYFGKQSTKDNLVHVLNLENNWPNKIKIKNQIDKGKKQIREYIIKLHPEYEQMTII